ncbi:MAG: GNAT family N-acetyltransferase [Clostridia bacterium]|nr:GNAT family N-acetyltransferase [Clostridia bacterium]
MYIETNRLIIRDFIPDDLEGLHAIFGDEETMQNVEPAYTLLQTRDFLERFCIGQHGAVAAVHRESGQLIGYILCKEYEPEVYEIGWIFHRDFWRRGFAHEACSAVLHKLFTAYRAHKVFAEAIDAVKSVGLMRKLGMQPEGIQRSQTKDNHGRWTDLYFYGLLAEEYLAQR